LNGGGTDGGLLFISSSGSGTTTLTGANTYNGGTTVNSGTLQLGGSGTLGSTGGALTVNTGGTLDLNGTSQTVGIFSGTSGGLVVNNSGSGTSTLTVSGGDAVSAYAGVIADNSNSTSGTMAVSVAANGILILTGSNTYSGGTTILSGGVLAVGNTSGSATGMGNVSVSGTLLGIGSVVPGVGNSVTVNPGGTIAGGAPDGIHNYGTLSVGNNLTVTGASGGPGAGGTIGVEVKRTSAFSVTGGSSLIDLSSSMTAIFNLTSVGSGSTANIGVADVTGTLQVGENYTINLVKAYQASPLSPTTTNFQLNGATVAAGATIDSSTSPLVVIGGTGVGSGTLGYVNLLLAGNVGYAGALAGWSLGIDLTGTYLQLTLDGILTNHWTGATSANWTDTGNWSSGAAPISGQTAFFNQGSPNTIVSLGNATQPIGSITFDTAACAAYTLGGQPSDAFLFDAGGTVTVTSTVVNRQIFNAAIQTQGALNITNNGTGGLIFNGSLTLGGGTAGLLTFSGTGTTTYAGNISTGVNGLLVQGPGTVILSGMNSYTGGTTISSGTLNIVSDSALGAAAGVVNLNGGTLQFTAGGGIALNSSRNVILGGGAFDTNSGNDTINGLISGSSATTSNLIKNGAGTLILNNTNTYAGSTFVNVGAVAVSSTGGLSSSGALIVSNSNTASPPTLTTLYLFNAAQTVGPLSGTISDMADGNTAAIFLSPATTLTVKQTAAGTYQGYIFGGGSLILSSSSNNTLQLSGNSTYAGSTTINGGTVQLNVPNALPTTTALTLGAAGTLNLNKFNQTVFSLAGAGAINTGSGAGGILTIKNNNDPTFVYSGVMSGTGGLNVSLTAGSIQQLTGANSYTGPTNVNGGTLQMGANGALSNGATATVLTTANVAGATFDLNNFNVTTGPIQGGGVLGGGILLGLGTGATGSGGTLTIKLPFTSTFAGNITGNGNLILSGTGTTLILTGNNNINGSISADSYVAGSVGTNAQVFIPLGTGNGLDMRLGSQQIASLTGGDASGNNLQFTGNGVIDSANVTPTLTVAAAASFPATFNFGGGIFNDVSLTLDSSFNNLSQVMRMSGNSPTTGNFRVGNFNSTSSATSTLIVTGKLGDDGSNGGAGSLTVGNGGIVAGTGTIHTSVMVRSGGTLRGGFTDGTSNNTGTLTINVTNPGNNNVTLSQGSILQTEVSRIGVGSANASMISVTAGNFNLNPTTTGTFAISLLNSGLNDAPLVGGETYTINLAQMSGSGTIQLNGSPMARGFVIPATEYTVNSPTLVISNSLLALDSTGAYLQLTFTAVPEPEHIMLLCVGVLLAGLALRRRLRGACAGG